MSSKKFKNAQLSDSKVTSNMPDFDTYLRETPSFVELEKNLSCIHRIEGILESDFLTKSTALLCRGLMSYHKLGNIFTQKQIKLIDSIFNIQKVNEYKQKIWQEYQNNKVTLSDICRLEPKQNDIPYNIAIKDAKVWAKSEIKK